MKRLIAALALLVVLGGIEYVTGVEVMGDLDLVPEQWERPARTAEAPPTAAAPAPSAAPAQTPPAKAAPADATVRFVTWNLYNFGRSKNAEEIAFVAEQLREYEVVAIQEISTSPPGPQAIGRLVDALDRTGFNWDYTISDPTTGDGTERYAFLWKPSRVRLVGRAWLEDRLADTIDREPYCARFEHVGTGQRMLVASLHAIPRSKDPETEIRQLHALHDRYPDDNVMVVGDFNLDGEDEAFNGLRRRGYAMVLHDQKTSLGRKVDPGPQGHLASEYDNIFYETATLDAVRRGVIDFTQQFPSLRAARKISDHLPVYMHVGWDAVPPAQP
ncbi:endonuclease/exonuclease/phosphatase family protein [Salisaeta longa]|uniref:endonuclease/exonuclease/phosphatase family protein n=1 Tax=Salisaeta longa TaxID=503170 RepID=UPI0003B5DE4E|nr:endonuclease/exonuclease/phosphatase family protein [Salisaeta longa]